jgi:molybdenum cofactor guanylyltransferase
VTPIPIVILAGGQGLRIGGNKPHRTLGTLSLLEHVIARARHYGPDVAVAVAADDHASAAQGLAALNDSAADRGPIAGLQSALHHAEAQGARHVLVLACDMPFLPDDLATRLTLAIGSAQAALPESADRVHPACGLWATSNLTSLDQYLATGRKSLIGFAEMIGYVTAEWPVATIDPFFNINKADQLAQAELWLAAAQAQR